MTDPLTYIDDPTPDERERARWDRRAARIADTDRQWLRSLDQPGRPEVVRAAARQALAGHPAWGVAEVATLVIDTNRRAGATESASPAAGTGDQPCPAPLGLLDVLLAGLRGEQPESRCFLCLTSDDARDVCGEHQRRLAAIVRYGRDAA